VLYRCNEPLYTPREQAHTAHPRDPVYTERTVHSRDQVYTDRSVQSRDPVYTDRSVQSRDQVYTDRSVLSRDQVYTDRSLLSREPVYIDRGGLPRLPANNYNKYEDRRESNQKSLTPSQTARRNSRDHRWNNHSDYQSYAGGSSSAPASATWTTKGRQNNAWQGAASYRAPASAESHRGDQHFSRLDLYGGTGRVGYNNTPQPDRKASFSRGLSQPDFYSNRESPLPRSASAFENRANKKPHIDSPFVNRPSGKQKQEHSYEQDAKKNFKLIDGVRTEYDPYAYHDDLYIDEEPIYVPRSVMADIIHKNDDDIVGRRHRAEDLIELPSGARQKRSRKFSESLVDRNMESTRQRSHKGRVPEKMDKETVGNNVKTERKKHPLKQESIAGSLNQIVGLSVIIILAYKYSYYLHQLHENELWFTEIEEVEREISFRTEQGLYYSYFKQLVRAPSLAEGLRELRADNITESNRTINIMQRFNVHQEILLSIFYRFYNFNLRPILFYAYFVFSLQGVFLCALYLTAWSISGTWLSGVLTVVYVLMNRFDVTRVTHTVPLREHFSLPFIFLQFYTTGQYLREETRFRLFRIYLFGLVYSLTWQFAQFVSLLQALTLFGLATLGLNPILARRVGARMRMNSFCR